MLGVLFAFVLSASMNKIVSCSNNVGKVGAPGII